MIDTPPSVQPKPASLLARVVNYVFIAVGLAILVSAIVGIPDIGGKAGNESLERGLRIGAGVGIVLSLYVAVRRVRLGWLILLLSCLYFFVSCTAVFHWKGG
ncbi:MAG: hypothetical protein HYX47_10070 [Burkholderiales bacterium]|nr:hypothetical protein [Burkholderiales bacterium]